MGILLALLWLLLVACGIVSLVCLILVIIKMFQNNETTMGIVCAVTSIFCGIGWILTFILGWINVAKWKIRQVMLIWTGCFVATIVLWIIIVIVGLAAAGAQGGAEFDAMQLQDLQP